MQCAPYTSYGYVRLTVGINLVTYLHTNLKVGEWVILIMFSLIGLIILADPIRLILLVAITQDSLLSPPRLITMYSRSVL